MTGWPVEDLTAAARWYHTWVGWHTEVSESALVLPLRGGVVALSAPHDVARRMRESLTRWGLICPTVQYPGDRCAFLADANDLVIAQADLAPGLVLHRPPATVPLPPTVVRGEAIRWFTMPDPRSRWLPSLAAVLLAAIHFQPVR